MVTLKDEDPIQVESNPIVDAHPTIVVGEQSPDDEETKLAQPPPPNREHPAEDYIKRYVRNSYWDRAEVWAVVLNGLRFERVQGEDIIPPHSEIYIRIGRSGRND